MCVENQKKIINAVCDDVQEQVQLVALLTSTQSK